MNFNREPQGQQNAERGRSRAVTRLRFAVLLIRALPLIGCAIIAILKPQR